MNLWSTLLELDKINEDIYYNGSGNATLGEEELQVDGVEEDTIELEDEKNDVNTIEKLEEKGEEVR